MRERWAYWLTGALWLCAGWVSAQTITLAVEDDWAPYASVAAGGTGAQGYAVDLVREAFASQGVTVVFRPMPFARCLHVAEAGSVVGCFNATIVSGNRDKYHWHKTPMFHEQLAIFGPGDSQESGLTATDLRGKTLGYTLGYTYPTEIMRDPSIIRFGVDSDEQLIGMLSRKRVQYALLNEMPAYYRMQRIDQSGSIRKVGTISEDGFWVAFSKQHPLGKPMMQRFEAGLAAIKASGRYQALTEAFRAGLGL